MPLKEPQLLYVRAVSRLKPGQAELCIQDGPKTQLRVYPLTQKMIKKLIKDLAGKLI
jgi:hypothetical protein